MTEEQKKALGSTGKNKDSLSKNVLPIGLLLVAAFLLGSSLAKSKYGVSNKKVPTVVLSPTPTSNPSSFPSPTPVSELFPTATLTLIPTIKPTVIPTVKPTTRPTNSPTPLFDKNRGNNYVAAKYAQQIMDMANGVKADMVLDAYLRLDPEDIGNQSEDSYKNSVKTAVLAMEFDSSVWNIFDDSTNRSLVTTYLKYPLGIFAANTVGLTIIDSDKTILAKGTYDKREDKVNITVIN